MEKLYYHKREVDEIRLDRRQLYPDQPYISVTAKDANKLMHWQFKYDERQRTITRCVDSIKDMEEMLKKAKKNEK